CRIRRVRSRSRRWHRRPRHKARDRGRSEQSREGDLNKAAIVLEAKVATHADGGPAGDCVADHSPFGDTTHDLVGEEPPWGQATARRMCFSIMLRSHCFLVSPYSHLSGADIGHRPWACLGPGVSPQLVQTAFGNVYKQKSKCEWPGDARHAAKRFS